MQENEAVKVELLRLVLLSVEIKENSSAPRLCACFYANQLSSVSS